mmetsp:Transcript_12969/g.34313  ORF Transcript_12969/g.34313 Transcript_12969/m.34313 type:complete len:93 (-) Transcript_12969:234-512(-)
MAFKTSMDINLTHFIMSESKEKVATDNYDEIEHTSGFNHDELMYLAGRILCMIKFGLVTSVNKDGLGDDRDLPLPKKDKDAVFEVSKMKAVE